MRSFSAWVCLSKVQEMSFWFFLQCIFSKRGLLIPSRSFWDNSNDFWRETLFDQKNDTLGFQTPFLFVSCLLPESTWFPNIFFRVLKTEWSVCQSILDILGCWSQNFSIRVTAWRCAWLAAAAPIVTSLGPWCLKASQATQAKPSELS